MIFHAKEYPTDLGLKTRDSSSDSTGHGDGGGEGGGGSDDSGSGGGDSDSDGGGGSDSSIDSNTDSSTGSGTASDSDEDASGFDSHHPAYTARNLVWLASTNMIYVWRPPLYTKWEALLQLGVEWETMDLALKSVLKEEYGGSAPHRLAFTLSEAGFRDLAHPAEERNGEDNGKDSGEDSGENNGEVSGEVSDEDEDGWACDVNLLLRALPRGVRSKQLRPKEGDQAAAAAAAEDEPADEEKKEKEEEDEGVAAAAGSPPPVMFAWTEDRQHARL